MLPRQKPHANTSIDNTSFGRIIFVMDEASRLNGRRGRQPERELAVSPCGHHVDDLGFGQPSGLTEGLADAVARARTSNDELHVNVSDWLPAMRVVAVGGMAHDPPRGNPKFGPEAWCDIDILFSSDA